MIRCYSELQRLKTFEERYAYLRLCGVVGESTFGFDRYLNQALYHSNEWVKVRDEVNIRDNGCDLGDPAHEIHGRIIIHHMNPVIEEDILERASWIFDPEYLITTSLNTHNAIHFGDEKLLYRSPTERRLNDTCPWLL